MASPKAKKKILLVAMVDSIHVARWISQFDSGRYEFVLFPSTPNREVHPHITALAKSHGNVRIWPLNGRLSVPLWGLDLIFSNRVRAGLLSILIKNERPDFVHALEFQHGAYLAEQALRSVPTDQKFIATNYGSDIFWFQKFPEHERRIRSVLQRANFYSAECQRDVSLALDLGFSGKVLPVIPNAGGIDAHSVMGRISPAAERKIILVKGYDGWVGRATIALDALSRIVPSLAGLDVVFYSCNLKTLRAIRRFTKLTGVPVRAYPKKALSHDQMLDLFGQALVYVGVSLSDGISTSLLEALALGAFPVQTDTACTNEWFTSGENGLAITDISAQSIAPLIARAIEKAKVRQNLNLVSESTLERIESAKVRDIARTFYLTVS